jgi:hypothetical protein
VAASIGRSGPTPRTPGTPRSHSPAPPAQRASPFELDPQHLAAQIGRGFAAVLRQQGGSLTLRMEPASLGALKIRMDLDAGRVEATLEATSDRARRLLDDSLPALRSALEAHGLSVERLDVRLAESGPSLRDGDAAERQGSFETAPDSDGGAAWYAGRDGPGSEHPWAADAAEPMVAPDGIGVGSGGAPVILRLDTVA